MKLKDWVIVVLLCMLLVFWFLIFADGFMINWIGLFGTIICGYLLVKYSGFYN